MEIQIELANGKWLILNRNSKNGHVDMSIVHQGNGVQASVDLDREDIVRVMRALEALGLEALGSN